MDLVLQVISKRYEKGSIILTSNKTCSDARLCAAIADRITFRCTLIQTGTESYRYQATLESLFASTN